MRLLILTAGVAAIWAEIGSGQPGNNTKNHKSMMFTQTKEQYTPPRSEELELTLEGVIAASDPKFSTPFTGGGEDW